MNGLLLDGEDDAEIAARLRQRLAPLATGDPGRPYRFRRDGLSWALSIGLPYSPGGMTQVPCSNRWCRNLVLGRPTGQVRCDDCELAAMEAASARATEDVPPPPPAEVLWARITGAATSTADRPGDEGADTTTAENPGLPATVRDQIDLIAAVDPRAGQQAKDAARALYAPPSGQQAHGCHRDRVSQAMAVFTAVTDRYADLLAAHYAGSTM